MLLLLLTTVHSKARLSGHPLLLSNHSNHQQHNRFSGINSRLSQPLLLRLLHKHSRTTTLMPLLILLPSSRLSNRFNGTNSRLIRHRQTTLPSFHTLSPSSEHRMYGGEQRQLGLTAQASRSMFTPTKAFTSAG